MKLKNILTVLLCFSLIFRMCSVVAFAEEEGNSGFSSANVIAVGSSISGNISNFEDVDYYKITAPSNGKISLTFNHTIKASEVPWYIKIYSDESGTNVLSETSIRLNSNKSIELPYIGAVEGKSYYIKIGIGDTYHCEDLYGENYTIKSEFESSNNYEKEVNNDFIQATTFSLGSSVSGNISNFEDEDYYKITAPSNGKISLTFNHTIKASEVPWYIKIYSDESGTNVLSETIIGLNSNKSIELPYIGAVEGKSYYIKIGIGDTYHCENLYGENYTIKLSSILIANKLTRVTSSRIIKYSKLKKKTQKFAISATFKEEANKKFKIKSVPKKCKKYIKIGKSGKVTVKKGLKKGIYKIKFTITASETKHCFKTTITKMVKIVVR
ncbi:MAG: hypothetical protein K6D02_03860 [Lachnospiraceae bacterium]|nr:hypothetical protein [Lachnospiraceae bacterium]